MFVINNGILLTYIRCAELLNVSAGIFFLNRRHLCSHTITKIRNNTVCRLWCVTRFVLTRTTILLLLLYYIYYKVINRSRDAFELFVVFRFSFRTDSRRGR